MSGDRAQEALEPLPGQDLDSGAAAAVPRSAPREPTLAPRRRFRRLDRVVPALERLRWPVAVYLSSRVLYLLVAIADSSLRHWTVKSELTHWDGVWFLRLAGLGYPNHVPSHQSPLGFFPLYPLLMWVVAHALACSLALAGLLVSGVGGLIATVLIQRLSIAWWGEQASRRAVLFFCFFPGSIVFSMVYAEGVLIALVAGSLLDLERRRWLLAGVLAGFATAAGPTALPIIAACALAALIELRRRGWGDRSARKALIAPLLAPAGIVALGAFLWAWVGTPFGTFHAQRVEWGEKTNPLALVTLVERLFKSIHFEPTFHVNLNYPAGLLGAVFLVTAVVLLVKTRPRVSAPALLWTLGVGLLTVTSQNVPPNPRMLITAFPAVLVVAYRLKGRAFQWLMGVSVVLLIAMSVATYVGVTLRP